jgi:hypothetical protein
MLTIHSPPPFSACVPDSAAGSLSIHNIAIREARDSILGLRALYIALAGILPRFRYIHQALAVVLAFVGAKMMLSDRVAISDGVSLVVICAVLAVAGLASRLAAPAKATGD